MNAATSEPQVTPGEERGPHQVSVIFTLGDHRGYALQAVESWTLEQRCDPNAFEVIVVIDDSVRELEPEVRRRLRPQDRILRANGIEMEQYDIASRHALGGILLFTEPHCLAEPEAVAEVMHYFASTSLDGCCARSTHIAPNRVGRGEMTMCKDAFVEWSRSESWQKVIVRGFAVRRDAFFDAGGFDHRYDRFAEWLLAARLHTKGYRIGYAPGFGVSHVYCSSLAPLKQSIREFTHGECLFRLESESQEFCEQYFGSPPEWYEARSLDRPVARLLLRDLWRSLRRRKGATSSDVGFAACRKAFLQLVSSAALGEKKPLVARLLPVWTARARFAFWRFHEQRALQAFRDWYMSSTAVARVEFALEHARRRKAADPDQSYFVATMDTLDSQDIFGFHAIEMHRGTSFRWTSAVSATRFPLRPDDYFVTLQLNDARDVAPSEELSIYFNREPISPIDFDLDERRVTFAVPRTAFVACGDQWLVILCSPWILEDVHLRDPRPLGLPIVSIDVRPQSSGEMEPATDYQISSTSRA